MVIGLGRFGTSVARSLVELGHQVLAVDISAERVQSLADELPHVVQADTSDPDLLKQLSVLDFAHVVVAIGHDMEASVLTTLNLNQLGVRDIWVKAHSEAHGRIVKRLGAHHVIFPERDMGERVAHLVTGKMIDFVEFVDGFAIAKTGTPRELCHQSLERANVRSRFKVTIMGVKRADVPFIVAQPDTVLLPDDILIVAGETPDVEAFAALAIVTVQPEAMSE
ncbi:MAG: TrkA family potassium uptake protein [Brachymonas sp.]|nr:TrkA family potassium uptake protein [Brachymonas sp.]